jgi:hypothetical protein
MQFSHLPECLVSHVAEDEVDTVHGIEIHLYLRDTWQRCTTDDGLGCAIVARKMQEDAVLPNRVLHLLWNVIEEEEHIREDFHPRDLIVSATTD